MCRLHPLLTLTCALTLCHSFAAVIPGTVGTWVGRTLRDESLGTVSFLWEGVQASVMVSNSTTVSVTLASYLARGFFRVYVDSVTDSSLLPISPSAAYPVTLAQGLDPAVPHLITLYYITDPITMTWPKLPSPGTSVVVLGFEADGDFAPPSPPLSRRLLVIGDSISAGNQINATTCMDDHSGTYTRHLCDLFGANCTTLAISGIGLYENCAPLHGLPTMPLLSTRVFVGDESSVWNTTSFAPSGLILALGTNDQGNANGTAWTAAFSKTYADFLVELSATYGAAMPIFAAVGPITHDYYPWVMDAIAQASSRGVHNVHPVNFTTPVDKCGHPDYSSHSLMADQAAPIISAVLGW